MKRVFFGFFAISFFALTSCGGEGHDEETTDQDSTEVVEEIEKGVSLTAFNVDIRVFAEMLDFSCFQRFLGSWNIFMVSTETCIF